MSSLRPPYLLGALATLRFARRPALHLRRLRALARDTAQTRRQRCASSRPGSRLGCPRRLRPGTKCWKLMSVACKPSAPFPEHENHGSGSETRIPSVHDARATRGRLADRPVLVFARNLPHATLAQRTVTTAIYIVAGASSLRTRPKRQGLAPSGAHVGDTTAPLVAKASPRRIRAPHSPIAAHSSLRQMVALRYCMLIACPLGQLFLQCPARPQQLTCVHACVLLRASDVPSVS